MRREDRELLAELARLNKDMAQLGMRIVEGHLPGHTVEAGELDRES
ncbi:MAG: hypothetical protein ACRDRT_03395 [Pseudonocardiaceae bacterium]